MIKDHSCQNPFAALEPESLTELNIEPAFLPDSIMLDTKSEILPMVSTAMNTYMKLYSRLCLSSYNSIAEIQPPKTIGNRGISG